MPETLNFVFEFSGNLAGSPSPHVRIYVDVPGTVATSDDVEVKLRRDETGTKFSGSLLLPSDKSSEGMWFQAKFSAAPTASWRISVTTDRPNCASLYSDSGKMEYALNRFWGRLQCKPS